MSLLSDSVLKISPGAGCILVKPMFGRSDGRVVTLEYRTQGIDPASSPSEWRSLPGVNPTLSLGRGHTRLFIRARDDTATSTVVGPFLFNGVGTFTCSSWTVIHLHLTFAHELVQQLCCALPCGVACLPAPAPPAPTLQLLNGKPGRVDAEVTLVYGELLRLEPGEGCALTKPRVFVSNTRVVTLEYQWEGVDPGAGRREWVSVPAANPVLALHLGFARVFIRARDGTTVSETVGPFTFVVISTCPRAPVRDSGVRGMEEGCHG